MSDHQQAFYNRANLYIQSGVLRQNQVERAFATLFEQLRKAFPNDSDYSKAIFEVNVVVDGKGKLYNFTHGWVSEPKVYNIMVGLNPDGTKRVELKPDPKWTPPPVRKAEAPTPKALPKPGAKISWGDIMEEEDEAAGIVKDVYVPTPKMIEETLPPIATLPAVEYERDQLLAVARTARETKLTPYIEMAGQHIDADITTPGLSQKVIAALTQIQSMRTLYAAEQKALNAEFDLVELSGRALSAEEQARLNEVKRTLSEFKVLQSNYPEILDDIPRYGVFSVSRSFISPGSPDLDPATLCCRIAPSWVTEEMMHLYFDKFSTDQRFHEVRVNKTTQRIKHPQIRIKDSPHKMDEDGKPKRLIYVTYSKDIAHISDAAFALQMRRKFTIEGPEGQKAQLIFGHWHYGTQDQERPRPGALTADRPRHDGGRGSGRGRGGGRGGGTGRGGSSRPQSAAPSRPSAPFRPQSAAPQRGGFTASKPSFAAPKSAGPALPLPGGAQQRPPSALPPGGSVWRSVGKKP